MWHESVRLWLRLSEETVSGDVSTPKLFIAFPLQAKLVRAYREVFTEWHSASHACVHSILHSHLLSLEGMKYAEILLHLSRSAELGDPSRSSFCSPQNSLWGNTMWLKVWRFQTVGLWQPNIPILLYKTVILSKKRNWVLQWKPLTFKLCFSCFWKKLKFLQEIHLVSDWSFFISFSILPSQPHFF